MLKNQTEESVCFGPFSLFLMMHKMNSSIIMISHLTQPIRTSIAKLVIHSRNMRKKTCTLHIYLPVPMQLHNSPGLSTWFFTQTELIPLYHATPRIKISLYSQQGNTIPFVCTLTRNRGPSFLQNWRPPTPCVQFSTLVNLYP